jgi:hypothetical protein
MWRDRLVVLVNSGEQAESLSSSRLIGLGGGYAVIGCGTYMEEQQMIEGRVAWIGVAVPETIWEAQPITANPPLSTRCSFMGTL